MKYFLIIIVSIILSIILLFIYCSLVLAHESDKYLENNIHKDIN